MTETGRSFPYTIIVTQHRGVYELSTPELLLTVRATDLQDGYERLRRRQQEVVDFACGVDALDELPPPAEPPALKTVFR
jgi:hypothetical protein